MYWWMRHFFTEDVSPATHPLIELERRASWVGLALVLQALNEIQAAWYLPYVHWLRPYVQLIPFFLILGSFIAMWQAFRPITLKQQAQDMQKHPSRGLQILLVLALLTIIGGGIELGRVAIMCFQPPRYSNDGATLDSNAATLLLQGRNPYTDSNMVDIARHYPILPNWTTPLRVGQFAHQISYPNSVELRTVLDTDLKAGKTPEFESKVSYPALSFLTLVPVIWLHLPNVIPFYLASYLLLVFLGWKFARPELRPWLLVFSMTNVPMWSSVFGGNLDIFYSILILMVWLLRERTWASSLFLGLALATKQIAWFFIPFYIILIWRSYGFREIAFRLLIAGSIGLIINLPFILWNPSAWLTGILTPIADPMFPLGAGLVGLGFTPFLPVFPPFVYSILEALALLLSIAWYWRLCKEHPESVMLLAVLPLFFAWRSLPSYFYCSAFLLFMLLAAKVNNRSTDLAGKVLRVSSQGE